MSQKGKSSPYTEAGLSRQACARCMEHPAEYQYQCPAAGARWLPVCERCDLELNTVLLRFFQFLDYRERLNRYAETRNNQQ